MGRRARPARRAEGVWDETGSKATGEGFDSEAPTAKLGGGRQAVEETRSGRDLDDPGRIEADIRRDEGRKEEAAECSKLSDGQRHAVSRLLIAREVGQGFGHRLLHLEPALWYWA
jgi:hypothetical protein